MVNFFIVNNNVRFEIDAKQASDSGLQISSKLLTLAANSSTATQ
jgi:hypothetical protein